jgi:hypothetical protein
MPDLELRCAARPTSVFRLRSLAPATTDSTIRVGPRTVIIPGHCNRFWKPTLELPSQYLLLQGVLSA